MGNCKSRARDDVFDGSSSRKGPHDPEKHARLMFYGSADYGTADTAIGSSGSGDALDTGDGTSFTTDNSGLAGVNLLNAEGSSFTTDNSGLMGVTLLGDTSSFATDNSGLLGVTLLGDSASFTEHDHRNNMSGKLLGAQNSPGLLSRSQNHHSRDNGYMGSTSYRSGVNSQEVSYEQRSLLHETVFEEGEECFDDEVDAEQSLLLIKSPPDSRKLDEYYESANHRRRKYAHCQEHDQFGSQLVAMDHSLDDIKASIEHIRNHKRIGGSNGQRRNGSGAYNISSGRGSIRSDGTRSQTTNSYGRAYGGDYRRREQKSRNNEAYRDLQRSLMLQDDENMR